MALIQPGRGSHLSIALAGLVAVGAILRVLYFAPDTSLWGDEAAVIMEVRDRPASQLHRPLGDNQQAPYLFLLTEKALLSDFGLNEHWLRVPALVASLVALVLFAWLARGMLSSIGAVFGVVLFAFCPRLIRYAAEVKPYAGDAAATLTVLCLAVMVIRSNWATR